jgi:hypothetical protein
MRVALDAAVQLRRSAATALIAAAALIVLLLPGCDGISLPPPCTMTGVTVSANHATITAGATTTLTATLNNAPFTCNPMLLTWSSTPGGGTLTPNGATATFGAIAAGTYTIRATSINDPTKSGTATVNAVVTTCAQPNGTTVTHSGNVMANQTWTGDGVTHLVTGGLVIFGTSVVTIEPCAIVALGPNASIAVRDNATLLSAGTAADRFVLFRRNDPNQAWANLRNVSTTSRIDLTWTRLQGGGAAGGMNDATIAITGNGYASPLAPLLRTDNVTIETSRGAGVFLDANGAFTGNSRLLTIAGSGGRPVITTMAALGTIPSGTYTGNTIDEILLAGPNANVNVDLTVEDRGVPVRIPYGSTYIGPATGSTVPVTLTLRPGVIFKFPRIGSPPAPSARMTFGTNGAAPNNLVGVLNAVGTVWRPIVFTSGETNPAPGDWIGIWLNTANNSRLEYVEISYAGAPSGLNANNCRPASTTDQAGLFIGSFSTQYVPPSTTITKSRITNSAGFGIDAMWLAGMVNQPDLTATNAFQNNARCRQTFNGLWPAAACPVRGCTAP